MKLTDANKIRDYVKGQINPYGKPFEGSVYDFGLKIMHYIDAMDSAYDIDNVIEELEKEAERWEDSGKEYKDKCEIAVGRGLRNSIEIVKHAGVSGDCCEWESGYGFVSDKYKRETSCGYTFYDLHHATPFKYCPYCGKKIKVVK